MRLLPFSISALVTLGITWALNQPWSGIPALGHFFSPQHGFAQNAEPVGIDYNTDLLLTGLQQDGTVYIDTNMVPHVFTANDRDAYYLQGYLHAKFRLWQMEFQTHVAAGRLSEIIGERGLQNDRQMRRLGMVFAAENAANEIMKDPRTKKMVLSYTEGVNAYIRSLSERQYPVEYKLLGYAPEPWNVLKTALMIKAMALDLAGHENDFEYTNAKHIFDPKAFEQLYPVAADSLDPIVPTTSGFAPPAIAVTSPADADSAYFWGRGDSVAADRYIPNKENGSNNWVMGPSKTQSGKPILCSDPHLGLNLPSLWFEIQLHTNEFNAYGSTFPGAPGVVIGFNDSIAWGVTNAGRDVRDYYEIMFKDTSKREYRFNNAWQPTDRKIEIFNVKGKGIVRDTVAYTSMGPVMFDHSFPDKLKTGKNYAVRWKAHDPSNEMMLFYKINRAKNYNDYYDAIQHLEVPGQNFAFAAANGEIALWQQGKFPAKWYRQGDFIMPGTDSSYFWQGMIPREENPHQINPERGFVSSANQLAVDRTYPYYIGGGFPLYRGIIINRLLSQMNQVTPDDMMTLQTNNYNVFAETAMPVLLKNIADSTLPDQLRKWVITLKSWDKNANPDAVGATVFNAWWDSLEVKIWSDEIAQSQLPVKWPETPTLVEALLRDFAFQFIDNITTSGKETLAMQVLAALEAAAPALEKIEKEGKLPWAKFKDTQVRHLMRLEPFSRLHLPIGGGRHIINATTNLHGPSWRMVVHLTTPIEAYAIYPGGQIGNPGSKYYDNMINDWAAGKYHKIFFMQKGEEKDSRVKYIIHCRKA